jgi:predicted secreted protein
MLSQVGQEASFHVDHIIPEMDGGGTVLENLALACVSCSLRKGARQSARDPLTRKFVRHYHPRQQIWKSHFRIEGYRIVGVTACGRATVDLLKLNRMMAQHIRSEEFYFGRFPPSDV